MNALGFVLQRTGKWLDAESSHREASRISARVGDLAEALQSVRNLKDLYIRQRQYQKARDLLVQHMSAYQGREGEAYNTMGWLYEEDNDLSRAKENYEKAYRVSNQTGDAVEKEQALRHIDRIKTKRAS